MFGSFLRALVGWHHQVYSSMGADIVMESLHHQLRNRAVDGAALAGKKLRWLAYLHLSSGIKLRTRPSRLLQVARSLATLLQQLGDQRGPSGLVTGADAGPGVPVEILMERNEVAPVIVLLKLAVVPEHRSAAFVVTEEDAAQPAGNLPGYLPQCQVLAGTGWALHLEAVAEALAAGEAEETLLQDWILFVPQREREADALVTVANPGDSFFVPAVRLGTGRIVGDEGPRIAIGAVIFAHRAPGTLGDVWPPTLPVRLSIAALFQPFML